MTDRGDRTAAATALCSLGDGDDRLTYLGYDVRDLAASCSFEAVVYLLLRGRLPDPDELDAYRERLVGLRSLPDPLADVLVNIPPSGPMGGMVALRTAVSLLGAIEPEASDGPDTFLAADRLVALIPGVLGYWVRSVKDGACEAADTEDPTTAGFLLALLTGSPPDPLARGFLDVSLVLYAELAYNASTYACRVSASTGADIHACVTAGIATLSGPLHGGASVAVSEMLQGFGSPEEAEAATLARLDRRERVAGFGHAIFREDPRSPVLEAWAERLAAERGDPSGLLDKARAVARVVRLRKGLRPNVDFYTACSYGLLGLPIEAYSPLFVCARVAGWCAHVAEQRRERTLIHPAAVYKGPAPRPLPTGGNQPALGPLRPTET